MADDRRDDPPARRAAAGPRYSFLFTADVGPGDRLPRGTYTDRHPDADPREPDSLAIHRYDAPQGIDLRAAVRRALRRLGEIEARYPQAWGIDDEADLIVAGRPVETVDILALLDAEGRGS